MKRLIVLLLVLTLLYSSASADWDEYSKHMPEMLAKFRSEGIVD